MKTTETQDAEKSWGQFLKTKTPLTNDYIIGLIAIDFYKASLKKELNSRINEMNEVIEEGDAMDDEVQNEARLSELWNLVYLLDTIKPINHETI